MITSYTFSPLYYSGSVYTDSTAINDFRSGRRRLA
jgi:hypothetical protein